MHFSLFLYPFLTSRLDNKVQSLNESVYLGRFQVNSDRISSQHKNLVSLWPVITKLQPFLLFNLTPTCLLLWFVVSASQVVFIVTGTDSAAHPVFCNSYTSPPPVSQHVTLRVEVQKPLGGGQQQRKEIQWICA